MNCKQMEAKFRRYERWSRSTIGQRYLIDLYTKFGATEPRPSFRLLVIAKDRLDGNDDARADDLSDALRREAPMLLNKTWITTIEQIRKETRGELRLQQKIWWLSDLDRSPAPLFRERRT